MRDFKRKSKDRMREIRDEREFVVLMVLSTAPEEALAEYDGWVTERNIALMLYSKANQGTHRSARRTLNRLIKKGIVQGKQVMRVRVYRLTMLE